MGLANLSGLIFLLSIPALIYIYYFSRKKKRVEISSIIPWRLLKESVITSSLFRADILFYLQLLILLLLVVAACRPYWQPGAPRVPGRHLILVMDRSASMQSRDGKSSRWEAAREKAVQRVRGCAEGDRVTIIAAGAETELLVSAEGKRSKAEAVLRSLEPADTPDRLGPAIDLAISMVSEEDTGKASGGQPRKRGEIYVFTDRTAESLGIEKLVSSRLVVLEHVGSPEGNAAITASSAYRNMLDPAAGDSIFVTVDNFSGDSFSGRLSLRARGIEVASAELSLPPRGSRTTKLGRGLPDGLLEVVLEPPDALAVDNRAYALAVNRGEARVALFTRDSRCRNQFETLAAAIEPIRLDVFSPADYPPADMDRYRLTIFHRSEPAELPPGNLLVIFPPPAGRLVNVIKEKIRDVAFLDWDEEHPVGRDLRGLDGIELDEARVVEPPAWGKPVVVSAAVGGDIPLVLCGRYDGRRVAVACFDTAEIDLESAGSTPALVLVLNLISWLCSDEGDQVGTGETYETFVPVAREPATAEGERARSKESANAPPPYAVVDPRGRKFRVRPDRRGRVVFRETDYTGRYILTGDETARTFVANLCSPTESDLSGGGGSSDRVDVGGAIYLEEALGENPDRTGLFLGIVTALLLLEWLLFAAQKRGWVKAGES